MSLYKRTISFQFHILDGVVSLYTSFIFSFCFLLRILFFFCHSSHVRLHPVYVFLCHCLSLSSYPFFKSHFFASHTCLSVCLSVCLVFFFSLSLLVLQFFFLFLSRILHLLPSSLSPASPPSLPCFLHLLLTLKNQ